MSWVFVRQLTLLVFLVNEMDCIKEHRDTIDEYFKREDRTEENDMEFISDLFLQAFSYVGERKKSDGDFNKEPDYDEVRDLVYRVHQYWQCVREYLRNTYNFDTSEYFALSAINMVAMENSSWLDQQFLKACREVLIDDVKPDIGMVREIDKDLVDRLNQTDTNLLKEFFETFNELGSYHRNINDYEDEEKKNLHIRLMSIFTAIEQSTGK